MHGLQSTAASLHCKWLQSQQHAVAPSDLVNLRNSKDYKSLSGGNFVLLSDFSLVHVSPEHIHILVIGMFLKRDITS